MTAVTLLLLLRCPCNLSFITHSRIGSSPRLQRPFVARNRHAVSMASFWSRDRQKKKRVPHDEVVLRKNRKGLVKTIPQAKRYVSADWFHILRQTPTSVVLKRVKGPVLVNVCWALFVAVIQHYSSLLPGKVLAQPHSLTGR